MRFSRRQLKNWWKTKSGHYISDEIGLIYRIDIADDHTVKVDMSLTSPNCPSAQELPVMVQNAVSTVPGVGKVDVSVVWDPPWDPSRMSEEARVVLNML